MRVVDFCNGTITIDFEVEDLFALARACRASVQHAWNEGTADQPLFSAFAVALESTAVAASAADYLRQAEESPYTLGAVRAERARRFGHPADQANGALTER